MNFKRITVANDFCQLSETLITNVNFQLNFGVFASSQLFFWPFVICQLTPGPSKPSNICPKYTSSVPRNSWEQFSESEVTVSLDHRSLKTACFSQQTISKHRRYRSIFSHKIKALVYICC